MKKKILHTNKYIVKRICSYALVFCMLFASDVIPTEAANFEAAAVMGIEGVLENTFDDEEIDEADPDEFVTGAGVELIIGSIDSMTKQDFEDLMENLVIVEEEEPKENWGYENLGVADVSESLNVRRNAGTDSEKIGELPAGAGCEILDTADGWAHIRSGSVEGYVSLDYLATGERAEELAQQNQTLTATVLAQALKVRKQPDTEHGTWGLIANGRELEVVEVLDNGWVSVVYGDGMDAAYVSGEYVDVAYRLDTALTMMEVRYGKGVTDAGIDLANRAIQYVGCPYVYGGTSLSNGTDCSGFTMLLYAKYGISLAHSARAQARCGSDVSISQLRPGDLVFYSQGGSIDHVAIYIGGGKVCHASNPTNGIIITGVNYRTPVCARRLL
ncbi:MAG: SH3 domain-containing protein [Lachnospiraceae bacterium]|nr:SH3 domain-containing protein [Lachnospiraceae bacterium]